MTDQNTNPVTNGGWTSQFLTKLKQSQENGDGTLKIEAEEYQNLLANALHDPCLNYNGFILRNFGLHHHYPHHICSTSLKHDSKYGGWAMEALHSAYMRICKDLYTTIIEQNIPGIVTEFGVFRGSWLKQILDHMDAIGKVRETYGFDSFEGLPKPDYNVETENWLEGDFCASIEEASANLEAARRPHLKLIKGWFKDTFPISPAKDVTEISYAKIDCDMYEPTVEILDYLGDRLSHGSYMVFDDWTHVLFAGETRAFVEWMPRVPHLEFEVIGFLGWQYIIRVWHKGKARI